MRDPACPRVLNKSQSQKKDSFYGERCEWRMGPHEIFAAEGTSELLGK